MQFSEEEKTLPLFEKPALAKNSSSLLCLQIVPSLWVSMPYQEARHVQLYNTVWPRRREILNTSAAMLQHLILTHDYILKRKERKLMNFVYSTISQGWNTQPAGTFSRKKNEPCRCSMLLARLLYNCDAMNGDLRPERTWTTSSQLL